MDDLIGNDCYAAVEFAKYATTTYKEDDEALMDIAVLTEKFISHRKI